MSFPKISDILKKVRLFDKDALITSPGKKSNEIKIKGLRKYNEAEKGELSWISGKSLEKFDLAAFSGSMLICPDKKAVRKSGTALIFSKNPKLLFAKVAHAFFSDQTKIVWAMRNAVIAPDAKIGKNVMIASGAVIGSGVKLDNNINIGPNTVLANCHIGSNSSIGANCSIGFPGFGFIQDTDGSYVEFPHLGKVVIGKYVRIGSNTCIDRGALGDTVIGDGVKIDNLVHVAHNVVIGKNTLVIANTMIGGSTIIGENVWVSPSTSLLNKINVKKGAFIGMGAVVLDDVSEKSVVVGNPGRVIRRFNEKLK